MDKGKGKSPTQKNKELLGGKNTLPTKDGVNEKTLKEIIKRKGKELNKPYTEREGIKKTPLEKSKEPPKSKNLGGKGGRGGGAFTPSSFPNRINNKLMLPPKPFVENKENTIENEKMANLEDGNLEANLNSPEVNNEEKEKIVMAMKDSEIDEQSIFTEQPLIENEPQTKQITEPKNQFEEKEKIVLAMRDVENTRPKFLENIEQEPIKDFDMPEPSFDGDVSDGSDGGDGGDGGE